MEHCCKDTNYHSNYIILNHKNIKNISFFFKIIENEVKE